MGELTNLEFRYAVVRKCLGQSTSVADIEAGIARMPWYSVKTFEGRGFGGGTTYVVVTSTDLHSGWRAVPAGSRPPALRGGPIIERFEHVAHVARAHGSATPLRRLPARAGTLATTIQLRSLNGVSRGLDEPKETLKKSPSW